MVIIISHPTIAALPTAVHWPQALHALLAAIKLPPLNHAALMYNTLVITVSDLDIICPETGSG